MNRLTCRDERNDQKDRAQRHTEHDGRCRGNLRFGAEIARVVLLIQGKAIYACGASKTIVSIGALETMTRVDPT